MTTYLLVVVSLYLVNCALLMTWSLLNMEEEQPKKNYDTFNNEIPYREVITCVPKSFIFKFKFL